MLDAYLTRAPEDHEADDAAQTNPTLQAIGTDEWLAQRISEAQQQRREDWESAERERIERAASPQQKLQFQRPRQHAKRRARVLRLLITAASSRAA